MAIKNFQVAKDKARLQFWQKNPGVNSFEKGPDVVNNEPLTALDALGTSERDLIGSDSANRLRIGGALVTPMLTPFIFQIQPSASVATTPFFVNGNFSSPVEIAKIDCIFSVANGAALTGKITKETAAVAPGSGSDAQSGTFNLNATAVTLQTATLVGVRGVTGLVVNAGEQLSFKLSTTVTSLAGLKVIVWVQQYTALPPACGFLNANAAIATKTIYLNIVPGTTVIGVAMRWSTAGSDAGTVTADVTKDVSTNAPGAGTTVLAAAQSVKGTANTTVYPALSATASVLNMAAGDRLALKMTGTLTALVGLVVTVFFDTGLQHEIVIQNPHFLNVAVDNVVFIADGYYEVRDFWGTWSVASTSNKNLLTKDTGTTAAGAGTGLLTDSTNAGLDTAVTANTPLEGTLVTVKPSLILGPGDRLGEKNAGTTGALAGMFTAVRLRKL